MDVGSVQLGQFSAQPDQTGLGLVLLPGMLVPVVGELAPLKSLEVVSNE